MSTETDHFDAFYRATSRRVLGQMYAMTGDSDDAQDCVQEAYARAWQHWGTVRQVSDPDAWIRTVAWRIAASRWRKRRSAVRALSRSDKPEHVRAPTPDHVALVTALRQIRPEHRRAIVLHYLVGMTVQEIAGETGSAPGTVKSHLHRGRAALARLLSEVPAGEPEVPA